MRRGRPRSPRTATPHPTRGGRRTGEIGALEHLEADPARSDLAQRDDRELCRRRDRPGAWVPAMQLPRPSRRGEDHLEAIGYPGHAVLYRDPCHRARLLQKGNRIVYGLRLCISVRQRTQRPLLVDLRARSEPLAAQLSLGFPCVSPLFSLGFPQQAVGFDLDHPIAFQTRDSSPPPVQHRDPGRGR